MKIIKALLLVLGVLVLAFGSFDYNYNGVILMLIVLLINGCSGMIAKKIAKK